MACTKSLLMSAASGTTEYPLDEAVYVPSVDKIFGAMGAYVLKLNALTGAVEGSERIIAPAQGNCGICYHALTDMVYVSVWNAQDTQYGTIVRPHRDIFPVDPLTLNVGAGLGLPTYLCNATRAYPMSGPRGLVSYDHYLYFMWQDKTNSVWLRAIDPANTADRWSVVQYVGGNYADDYNVEQITVGGPVNKYIHFGQCSYPGIRLVQVANPANTFSLGIDLADQGIIMPISAEYCPLDTFTYYVCGNQWLMIVDNFGTFTYSSIDLTTVGDTNPKPIRLRYCNEPANPWYQKILIPSAGSDVVTVYDPDPLVAAVVDWVTGFDSPVDVVFTPTKAFAVQNSGIGLKEIL